MIDIFPLSGRYEGIEGIEGIGVLEGICGKKSP
jgi:hypothetical protein